MYRGNNDFIIRGHNGYIKLQLQLHDNGILKKIIKDKRSALASGGALALIYCG